MASYDTQVCEESFGNGLVDAWREKRTECCPRSGDGYDSSSIRCHLMHQVGTEHVCECSMFINYQILFSVIVKQTLKSRVYIGGS